MSAPPSISSIMEEGASHLTMEEQAHAEALLASQPARVPVHQADCFDFFCRFLNIATAICAVLCAISYGMALWIYQPVTNMSGILDQVLRVAGLLGAMMIAIIESEWEPLLNLFRFAEYWVGRSIMQIFIALFTFKMASAAGKNCQGKKCDFDKTLELYRSIAAAALLCCGVIYLLGGALCFGLIKRSRSSKERKRLQAQRDLDELDHKRSQLRALLGHSDES